jgi:hypothetical protein
MSQPSFAGSTAGHSDSPRKPVQRHRGRPLPVVGAVAAGALDQVQREAMARAGRLGSRCCGAEAGRTARSARSPHGERHAALDGPGLGRQVFEPDSTPHGETARQAAAMAAGSGQEAAVPSRGVLEREPEADAAQGVEASGSSIRARRPSYPRCHETLERDEALSVRGRRLRVGQHHPRPVSRMILPMCRLDSMSRCASSAWSNGRTTWMIG